MDRATLDRLVAKGFEFDQRHYELADMQTKYNLEREEAKKKNEESLKLEEAKKLEEQQNQQKNKKAINLMIVLDETGISQFQDVINDVWEVQHTSSFALVNFFRNLNKLYIYKNICVVHHGDTFSDHTFNKENKIVFGAGQMKEITNIVIKQPEPKEINDDYIESVYEKIITTIDKNITLNIVKSYFSLKILLNQIQDGGCFFSIACNEAQDLNFNVELARLTTKEIKIFSSTNYATIESHYVYPITNPVIINFGSILNSFLTSSDVWKNKNGWVYYDTKEKKQYYTKKDLWLYGHNKKNKVYELIYRNKKLTNEQEDKQDYYQMYFSKKFKKNYIKIWGESEYNKWKKETENKYPEFK